MAKLNIIIPHHLTEDEARKRSKTLLKERFADEISNLQERWNGNTDNFSFSSNGFSISGVLIVRPSEVEISGDLPFGAGLFKGRIESMIKERVKSALQ